MVFADIVPASRCRRVDAARAGQHELDVMFASDGPPLLGTRFGAKKPLEIAVTSEQPTVGRIDVWEMQGQHRDIMYGG